MTEPAPRPSRAAPFALVLAVVALGASLAQWLGIGRDTTAEQARSADLTRAQQRLDSLEESLQHERDELAQLAATIGAQTQAEGTLAGRLRNTEDTLARLTGAETSRFLWQVSQAEHFLRVANAQETIAGNSAGALAALEIADQHLRDAADPRLATVRKLVASEIGTLRALPRIDTEGMTLRLATLAAELPRLVRRQAAPSTFAPDPAAPPPGASGLERALAVLKNAFLGVVSVRRSDEPAATLLTAEAASLLDSSLALELQMARLALLRGEAQAFRAAIAAARERIDRYFDTATPAVGAALATLDELAATALPDALPDISGSLTELLRVKEREGRP